MFALFCGFMRGIPHIRDIEVNYYRLTVNTSKANNTAQKSKTRSQMFGSGVRNEKVTLVMFDQNYKIYQTSPSVPVFFHLFI